MKITRETKLSEIVETKENAEVILAGFGLHCVHCPMAAMETVEDACMVHGLDIEEVLKVLNEE